MHFFNMLNSVAQEDVKHTVNTILGGQATTTCRKAAQKDRLGRKNVSPQTRTVQQSKGHQTMTCVGDVHGSRAYSARRFAQVRPTAPLLLTGSTLLGRMTDYQRDRVFACNHSEKVDEQ